jgi:hypothetical protein
MPLIDVQCHFGAIAGALTVRPPELAVASAYANDVEAQMLCFSSDDAATDLEGGSARLGAALKSDPRFRGWLTLSVHQPALSQTLARRYLVKSAWVGARFDQCTEADAVNSAGGHVVLNALRRYGRPVMMTVHDSAGLHAAIDAAKEYSSLRFILSPQTSNLTSDAIPAIKDNINMLWMPSAAYAERDVIVQAVETLGERRILWASDWGRLHPAAALGMIGESALSGMQRERIVWRNVHEVLSASE